MKVASLKFVCLFAIVFFFEIIVSQESSSSIEEFVKLVEKVQSFYLSRSVVIVYDKCNFGFSHERKIVEAIRMFSHKDYMSQAIGYDDLSSSRRENVLHSLFIDNTDNLQRAIEATRNVDMSLHPWLLVVSRNSSFDCDDPDGVYGRFFKLKMDVKMTAKCEGNNILKKYHSVVANNRTEVVDLAMWTPNRTLAFIDDKSSLVEIVMDLKGITLKLARRDKIIEEAAENLSNFFTHLIGELEVFGNFVTTVTVRDGSVGKYDPMSQRWNGLISAVHEEQADIGLHLFSMSKSRLMVVDFATTLARPNYYLFAKLPKAKKVRWTAYFQAFDMYTWIAMGLSILMSSVALSLMKNRYEARRFLQNFFGNFIQVWGIYCQQGIADLPTNTATQIIYFSCLISSLILNVIYGATITSYITALEPRLPFDNYEEFKRDTSYAVIAVKNSRDETVILQSTDPYLTPLKSRLKVSCELPINPYDGFQQVCDENAAFYVDHMVYEGIKRNPPCQLGRLDMDRIEYESIILSKNSPYTKTISYFISRLRDHGILKRLKNQYFYKYTQFSSNRPNYISVDEAMPVLFVWIVGVFATLIVWFLEFIIFYLSCSRCSTNARGNIS